MPTSSSSTPAAFASARKKSSTRAWANCAARRANTGTTRSSPSPAASRSRKATRSSSAPPASPTSSSARRRSAGCRCWSTRRRPRAAGRAHRPRSVRRCDVPARRDAARRSGQGVRDDHRRLQRVLQFLRRAVHARPRADAPQSATSWPRSARRRPPDTAKFSCSGRSSTTMPRRTTRACDFTASAGGHPRRRRHRAHPLRQPSSAPRHAALPGGDGAAAEDLPPSASAGAVGFDARARGDAPPLHARELSRTGRARFAQSLPDVALSTDMIVGFPGETDADFEETLTLTSAVGYHSMFSFKYSPRPNTLADKRLPDDVTGGREDAADRRAAGAAARHSDAAERAAGRAHRRRARGRGQPPARHRAVRPHEHECGREPAGAGRVDRPDGAGTDRARGPAQCVGPDRRRWHDARSERGRMPCKSK